MPRWPWGKGQDDVSEQWTDLGDPEPPVDAPPMEAEDPGGPPAHPPEGSAGEQAPGDAGGPAAGPDEPG